MSDGWIRLYRDIGSHWLWEEKPFSYGQAWIDLLMLVNHKDGRVLMDSQLVTVPAGSVITSELKLAERWGWGRTRLRSFLKLLESDGMIVKKTTNKRTMINIVNWGKFQTCRTTNEQQTNNYQTTAEQQANTNKNVKNIKNEKNEINGGGSPPEPLPIPAQTDIDEIIQTWNAQRCTRNIDKIPFGGRRYTNTMLCINNDLQAFMRTISELDQQAWFAERSRKNDLLNYDWFSDPNNYIKVTEGNYKDLRQTQHEETQQERSMRILQEATE